MKRGDQRCTSRAIFALILFLSLAVSATLVSGQTYTYTNGETNSASLTPSGSATLTIASGTATQSGSISASGFSLYKAGTGEIDLTSTASDAATIVDFGTLGVVGPGSSITTGMVTVGYASGDTGTLTVQTGGVLDVGGGTGTIVLGSQAGSSGALIVGSGSTSSSVEAGQIQGGNGAAQITFSETGSLTFAPSVTGDVNITQSGTGTTVLTGANTSTGSTTISSGLLRVSGTGGVSSGNLTIAKNATLDLDGTSQTISALMGTSTLTNTGGTVLNSAAGTTSVLTLGGNNASGTFTGAITNGTGTIALTKIGSGTEALTGTNTFSGLTSINGGTLEVSNNRALSGTGSITFAGGTLEYGSPLFPADYSARIVNSTSAISINPNGNSITFASGLAASNTGGLTVAGTGTLALTGNNAYTGTTTVEMGVLNLGNGTPTGSLNLATTLSMGGNGTFTYDNTTPGLMQSISGLNITSGVGTINNVVSGTIYRFIGMTHSGGGMVDFANLTGAVSTDTINTNGIIAPWAFTGTGTNLAYAVSNGGGSTITSLVGTTATAGSLANVTSNTGNYVYSASATVGGNLTANTLKYTGGASTTALGSNTLTTNGLMNSGTGTLTISGNAFASQLQIGSAGELDIISDSSGINIATGIGGTGTLAYGGPIGGTGTLTLSGFSTYTGGTVINAGTVVAANSSQASLGSWSNNLTVNSSGTLDLDGNYMHVNSLNGGGTITSSSGGPQFTVGYANGSGTFTGSFVDTVNGSFSGSVNLYKVGTGTQVLAGASTFNAATFAEGGELLFENGSNGSATGVGALLVSSTGTIGGVGTVVSQRFLIVNGTIIAGNGTDVTSQTTITALQASTMSGATLSFNLGTGTSQGESTELNLGATPLTITNTTLELNLVGQSAIQPGTAYTLITTSAPINAAAYGLTVNANGQITGGLSIDPNSAFSHAYGPSYLFISGDNIDVEVIPEPSTYALLLGGLGGMACLCLRRSEAKLRLK